MTILLKEDQTEIESTCDYEDYQYDSFYGNLLIMSDAELMEYKKDKYTPLHLAARYGHWEVAIDLLRNRAVVGAKDFL